MNSQRIRLLFLAAAIVAAFLTLLYRLWVLQIERMDFYVAKLPTTDLVMERRVGTRGRILDRNGITLAGNETNMEARLNFKAAIAAWHEQNERNHPRVRDRKRIPTMEYGPSKREMTNIVQVLHDTVLPRLTALGLYEWPKDPELYRKWAAGIVKWYDENGGVVPYPLATNLLQKDESSFEKIAAFSENALDIPGVVLSERPKRRYPLKALGGHFIGYLRETRQEKELLTKEERAKFDFFETDDVGMLGIEKTQDAYLRGKPGQRAWMKNEHGRLTDIVESKSTEPLPGDDILSTIDARIQTIAEQAMREAGVGRGAAAVINPNTGEVLALANIPSFDPNIYIPPRNNDVINALNQDLSAPSINRALADMTPGSTFKLVTGMAAAMHGNSGAYHTCGGSVQYGSRAIKCAIFPRAHGSLEITDAIKMSCNCYFMRLGNTAGMTKVHDAAAWFSLDGSPTGIELDTERSGLVRTIEQGTLKNGRPWSDGDTAMASMGQQITASPLQIAMVAAAVGNGGKVWQPTIIRQRIIHDYDKSGNPIKRETTFEPKLKHDLLTKGISPAEMEKLRKGMYKVVNEPRGTGGSAKSTLFTIAGKTGTAQQKRRTKEGKLVVDNPVWFMAFAPYEKPEIAVAVVALNGEGGGRVAAPIVKRIIERSLAAAAGNYQVQITPLEPAQGHFNKLDRTVYKDEQNVPAESSDTSEQEAAPDDEHEDTAAADPAPLNPAPRAEPVVEEDAPQLTKGIINRAVFRMKNEPTTQP